MLSTGELITRVYITYIQFHRCDARIHASDNFLRNSSRDGYFKLVMKWSHVLDNVYMVGV